MSGDEFCPVIMNMTVWNIAAMLHILVGGASLATFEMSLQDLPQMHVAWQIHSYGNIQCIELQCPGGGPILLSYGRCIASSAKRATAVISMHSCFPRQ